MTSKRKKLVLGKGDEVETDQEANCLEMEACRTLVDEGFEVILLTTARPTLMVNSVLSNSIHHLPFTINSVKETVETEKPDAVFPLPAGSSGWNLVH